MDGLDVLLRAKADPAMDVVSMGIAKTLEDSWGGDIAHLAHSTPEAFRFTSTDFNSCVTLSSAEGAPSLGIRPR